jgi:hypothetical protein
MSWKVAFILSLVLLVCSNIFWLYVTIDGGISYTYLQSSYLDKDKATKDLGSLIVKGSKAYSKKDLLHLLRQAKPEAFIVDEPNKLIFEGIEFYFKDDHLVEVR